MPMIPTPQTKTDRSQLLDKYKSMIGDFSSFLSHVPPAQLQALQQTFDLR